MGGFQIDVNFHIQKSLEIFDNNSADKILSEKDKEIKVSPLMSIRVKFHNPIDRNSYWVRDEFEKSWLKEDKSRAKHDDK